MKDAKPSRSYPLKSRSGRLPTELYLMLCRTLFRPIVWLMENGHFEWIAELLKRAAKPRICEADAV